MPNAWALNSLHCKNPPESFALNSGGSLEAETSLNPIMEALRIDDLRSAYCEQLEVRIAEQAAVIRLLQLLLTRAEVPQGPRDP